MSEEHVPSLAAGDGPGPRRSLLLAGGGIRVAYQAGVLLALEEAGLRFHHADGTSGGTFNLAMLLSGVAPGEACGRWRALDVRSFASAWPLRRLLAGPPYVALGTSEGIRRRVFPALGVDVGRIRAARGIDGTFNVCDFAAKTCVAVPHTEVDLDVLTAGVTLPVLSPAVRRSGPRARWTPSGSRTRTSPRRCGAARRSSGSSGASATTGSTATAPSSSTCT